MPTREENEEIWTDYSWYREGHEWSNAFGSSEREWKEFLLPRIVKFLKNKMVVLEIACGYGRWTEYLSLLAKKVYAVDITQKCVDHCSELFRGRNVETFKNNGKDLSFISHKKVDLIFSFDSLVHADEEAIEGYCKEFSRILTKDGVGVIHHSNIGSGITARPRFRDTTMSADKMQSFLRKYGLVVISQELINWGLDELIDCITIFTRATSKYNPFPNDPIRIENYDFFERGRSK